MDQTSQPQQLLSSDVSRRQFVQGMGVAGLALLTAGCGGASSASPAGQPASGGSGGGQLADKQTYIFGVADRDTISFDPAVVTDGTRHFFASEVHNALVRYLPGSIDFTKLEPDLAESWDKSTDGLTWTFKLRPGVEFHKGFGPVTAEDVKFTFDRLKLPGTKSAFGRPNLESVDVVDARTVRFHLKTKDVFFLADVANWNGGLIVSKKAVEQMGVDAFGMSPVGTGPFQVEEYRPQQQLVFKANPNYWRGKPILDSIIVRFLGPDQNVRALALRKREVIGVDTIDNKTIKDSLMTEGYRPGGRHGTKRALFMNLTNDQFKDPNLRQALAYGIDRNAAVQAFANDATVGYSVLSSVYPFSLKKDDIPTDLRYEYDPKKAKDLLAKAGLGSGATIKWTVPDRTYNNTALNLQEQLRQIGVTLDLQIIDWNQWLSVTRGNPNMVIWGGIEPTVDNELRSYFYSTASLGKPTAVRNWSHYGDVGGSIDKLLDEARVTEDRSKQEQIYRDVQLQILKDLPAFNLLEQQAMDHMRAPEVDLGYEFVNSLMTPVMLTEKTRILKRS
ncbi:MAG TPA: ABC transporter substrate-binding protein [Chloroflexota bacterium]|nr:ABC transporter substrate-binding protein [Chloroflexota bacterium]